jgi:pantothenate synthetase
MSSRNRFLDAESRARAIGLLRALERGRALIGEGERSGSKIEAGMRRTAGEHGLDVEYLNVVNRDTLEPLETASRDARLIGVVKCGGVRLLDNIAI